MNDVFNSWGSSNYGGYPRGNDEETRKSMTKDTIYFLFSTGI
jgi:hypothetical protein